MSRRRRSAMSGDHSYWQSYSDMMAALLLIFILIIAITLSIYRQKTLDLEKTQEELNYASMALQEAMIDLDNYRIEIDASKAELEDSYLKLQQAYAEAQLTKEELDAAYLAIDSAKAELASTKSELQNIVGIRTDIIGELQTKFNNSGMEVDAQTGSITFSSDVLFGSDSAKLSNDSKKILKEIIPVYLDVLLQDEYKNYIAEIIIEGHTDTNGTFEYNMELSSDRARSVATFCLDTNNGLSKTKVEQLQKLLTINGRSFSNPIYKMNSTEVDMAASRRVEIKFRLKEDEMIKKIEEILSKSNG